MIDAATGRRYDKDGNLKQWWTEDTLREYEERVQCIVQQYNQYNVSQLGDNFTVSHCLRCSLCTASILAQAVTHFMFQVNGINTQGENIADNGGLREALRAYRKFQDRYSGEQLLPGLTQFSPEQLFFLGFAHVSAGVHIPFVRGDMTASMCSLHQINNTGRRKLNCLIKYIHQCILPFNKLHGV